MRLPSISYLAILLPKVRVCKIFIKCAFDQKFPAAQAMITNTLEYTQVTLAGKHFIEHVQQNTSMH